MPELEPLKQWYCDVCGEIILSARKGYFVYGRNGKGEDCQFRIIHQGKCDDSSLPSSLALEDLLGPRGLIQLLTWLDVGPAHNPVFVAPKVESVREIVEIIRRVQIPYYEEARKHWRRIGREAVADGANEVLIYDPDFLRRAIEEIESEELAPTPAAS